MLRLNDREADGQILVLNHTFCSNPSPELYRILRDLHHEAFRYIFILVPVFQFYFRFRNTWGFKLKQSMRVVRLGMLVCAELKREVHGN